MLLWPVVTTTRKVALRRFALESPSGEGQKWQTVFDLAVYGVGFLIFLYEASWAAWQGVAAFIVLLGMGFGAYIAGYYLARISRDAYHYLRRKML